MTPIKPIKTTIELTQTILEKSTKWREHRSLMICNCRDCWLIENYIDSWVRLYQAGKL